MKYIIILVIININIDNIYALILNSLWTSINWDIINGIKGLDFEDKLTIQQVIRKYIDFNKINSITSLLGPGFAKEIINHNLNNLLQE